MNEVKIQNNISNRRFSGIERLYGKKDFYLISQAHLCVIGLGGVGSWVAEALARSGIGKLTLIDLDNVAESNVNRQIHALSSNFGKPKVSALAERILEINPLCEVIQIEDFVTEENISTIFENPFDFVIDAIDQMKIKAKLAHLLLEKKQKFIISGSAGGQKKPHTIQQADLSQVTHDRLLANMRYQLRKHYGLPKDTKKKMNIPCIYSLENTTPPQLENHCKLERPQGLSCSGYGASMIVTATFAMHLAHFAIESIIRHD